MTKQSIVASKRSHPPQLASYNPEATRDHVAIVAADMYKPALHIDTVSGGNPLVRGDRPTTNPG